MSHRDDQQNRLSHSPANMRARGNPATETSHRNGEVPQPARNWKATSLAAAESRTQQTLLVSGETGQHLPRAGERHFPISLAPQGLRLLAANASVAAATR